MSLFFFDATKVLVNGWFSHEDFGDEEDDDGTLPGFRVSEVKVLRIRFS